MRYRFNLQSEDRRRRELPEKLIIGQAPTETETNVLLRLLGFMLLFRPGLQVQTNLRQETIPFLPDLVQLDYEMRPRLWVECGPCTTKKLHKLRAKLPLAEIWILTASFSEAERLHRSMSKDALRRGSYHIVGIDDATIDEMASRLESNNTLFWVGGEPQSRRIQFDFNHYWFDAPIQWMEY